MVKKTVSSIIASAKKNGVKVEKAEDVTFQEGHPLTHLLLTETESEKGKSRTGSTVIVWAQDGAFQCCLTERDEGIKIFAGGATLADMWRTLEDRIASPNPDWVKDTKKRR